MEVVVLMVVLLSVFMPLLWSLLKRIEDAGDRRVPMMLADTRREDLVREFGVAWSAKGFTLSDDGAGVVATSGGVRWECAPVGGGGVRVFTERPLGATTWDMELGPASRGYREFELRVGELSLRCGWTDGAPALFDGYASDVWRDHQVDVLSTTGGALRFGVTMRPRAFPPRATPVSYTHLRAHET